MGGVGRDPLEWAKARLEQQEQAKIDAACGYKRRCIEEMRADGHTVTAAAPAVTAPAPKNHGPDVAANMMGGMGGS